MEDYQLTAIPTFRIKDYEKTIAFYIDFLGCQLDWEHRLDKDDPVYMQVSKNGLVLHLSESQRFHAGTIIYVRTHGIDLLHKHL